jgi:membrane protein YdbS with pleckstrin-like domain
MEPTRLRPRARTLFYLRAFLALLIFWVPATVVGAAALATVAPLWLALAVPGAVVFAAFLEALWLPFLEHRRWGYALGEDALTVERGVIVRRVTSVPVGRIQHVDTRQGPLERLLGLVRLQVVTASGMGADVVIPGLDEVDAKELSAELLAGVKVTDVDDGV